MWLRLALNALILIILSACSPSDKAAVDKLNLRSYAYHYRNLDSTEYYANEAFRLAADYPDGRAEALNNLAFVSMARMNYEQAEQQLTEAKTITDNHIELLVSEISQMRLCQRQSQNRAFYEHRENAVLHLNRVKEEKERLTEQQLQRLRYAESEMAIVTSTYYYYVGLERQSIDALQQQNMDELRRDTAQYLNYLYNVGAGGILTNGTPEEINEEEIDYLNRCLLISQRFGFPYFEAQAKEALAEHLGDLTLAEEALSLFQAYGDVYQIAGAYRTMASCYHGMGDDAKALEHLDNALQDERINQAPDLVASIREQLSVAYAAVNDKPNSDSNRNIYIDLQEQTRQDRELEARAGILEHAVKQLNWMILAVIIAIVVLLFLLWLFNHLNQKQKVDHHLDDLLEMKNEEVAEARMRVQKNERRNLEQRAKVSLAMSILPLINRILHEVNRQDSLSNQENLEYIRELTDNINMQNDLLTQWIQLRQGEVSLHIESFPLQALFTILERSKTSFKMKGIDLKVEPTEMVVKADKVLTLFMLNTLADNARKFTPEGGEVSITAQEKEDAVEISVRDTGKGMSEEELAHVFDHKVHQGHGFGLMNCKGIIEKYRKMSQLFSVCRLEAESQEGRGSRFFFRLPKGVQRMIIFLVMLCASTTAVQAEDDNLSRAHIFADSAYFCNVNGNYGKTLVFADSCRKYLNLHYQQKYPKGRQLMTATPEGDEATPAEIQWYQHSVETNYQIVLDIRNECAVAALALHEWQLYAYNNKIYTQLFKEMSADNSLGDYCRTMQQSQTNKRIAVMLLLVLLVLIGPAYYMLYYRHKLNSRYRQERQQKNNIEMADDELRRAELENANLHVVNSVLDNCLSTLKHETMYYPSRIRQLVDTQNLEPLSEVTAYYRDLYSILIQQATSQVERIKLHIRPMELYGQQVLGDENLMAYLFEMLKPQQVEAKAKDERYVQLEMEAKQQSPIDQLLCRQIVRDHGEATNRRGCGITVSNEKITIILPRYNGQL
jgi:signal transduction histidine kinase